jgi:PAS domain-containing protein
VACRKDGSRFPIEVGVSRMQLGERSFTIGSFRDISGRKQRVERDRVAFEEAPFGSVMSSPDGRIERVNHAICAMTGYGEDELLGTLLADLVHPDDRRAGEPRRRPAGGRRQVPAPVREPVPVPRRT